MIVVDFELEGQEFIAMNGGPAVQGHGSDIAGGELRHAEGSRRVLEQAERRWGALDFVG